MNEERILKIQALANQCLKTINNPYRDETNTIEQIKNKYIKELTNETEVRIFEAFLAFPNIELFKETAISCNNKPHLIVEKLNVQNNKSVLAMIMIDLCNRYNLSSNNETSLYDKKVVLDDNSFQTKKTNSEDSNAPADYLLKNAYDKINTLTQENFHTKRILSEKEREIESLKAKLSYYEEQLDLIRIMVNKNYEEDKSQKL